MLSSEWAAPNTFSGGFKVKDVQAGKYGQQIHLWDWDKHELMQILDFWETGLILLEIRFHHDPLSPHAFVGAALSSTMWHVHNDGGHWRADRVIEVPTQEVAGWPMPVPGLITDLVLSLDDRWFYFSNWLQGDIRRYDVSDPANPKLSSQLWCEGVSKEVTHQGRTLQGGGTDAATQPRRAPPLCNQLIVQQLGQSILSQYKGAGGMPAFCRL